MSLIAVIILASGSGSRFDSKKPKQYFNLKGKSIIQRSIDKFNSSGDFLINIVISRDHDEYIKDVLDLKGNLIITYGGSERYESVRLGLRALEKYNPDIVLIHDGCRPFFSNNLISNLIESYKKLKKPIIPLVPIFDSIKNLENEKMISVDRKGKFIVQTPQIFGFEEILELTRKNKELITEESILYENESKDFAYIEGERMNFKITTKDDYRMALAFGLQITSVRTGIGIDAHKFIIEESVDNFVILGGIKIPFRYRLDAHSDGDVLIHSLVDALLGSIAKGDIGDHFPPSDQSLKGKDSVFFLKYAINLVKEESYDIENIDLTIICEEPKLSGYKNKILENLAEIIEINNKSVNIKATTFEKMGFTGRGEGIVYSQLLR